MATGVICDYKTASVNKVKFGDFHDWYMQGMVYAWILTRNKFPVTQCRFIALLKDHSKTEAERDRQYPQTPVFVYEFPVKQSELFTIGAYVRSKAAEYEKYLGTDDDAIPACSSDQRWERPSKFAVKKEGRVKAVRVFDSQEEADAKVAELGAGHYVETRKGESLKCAHYCLCSYFCNFCQEQQNQETKPEVSMQFPTNSKPAERLAA
jgi:hypothetical protein